MPTEKHPSGPFDLSEARAKRASTPAETDSEMTMLRAALHEQGKLLGEMHAMMTRVSERVDQIMLHIRRGE